MNETAADSCLPWLLQVSYDLCANRQVQPLLVAITDAYLQLTGAARAYLLMGEAGPDALLTEAARGAGGLVISGPDRRALAAARSLLKDGSAARITESNDDFAQATALLYAHGKPAGVLYADGKLRRDWTQSQHLETLAKHASLALDNARLFERASNDLLTGLPNNSFFMQAVDKALQLDAPEQAGGILLLDLDNFKRVNAASGRELGDRALIDVAQTLRDTLSADGLVARFGSDKFGILLGPDDRRQVHLRLRDVAERARAAVGAKVFGGVQLSCCIGGVAYFAPQAQGRRQRANDVLSACDQVLSRVRDRGLAQVDIVVDVVD